MSVAAWWLLTRRAFPLHIERAAGRRRPAATAVGEVGPLTRPEWRMLSVGAATAALWIFREPVPGWGWLPALTAAGVVPAATAAPWISDGTIAMCMALACFLLPSGRQPGERLLEWRAAQRIPWAVVLLFGGAITLAHGLTTTGLDATAGGAIGGALASLPAFGLMEVLFVGAVGLIATQLTPSNLSTVAMLLPALTTGAGAVLTPMAPLLFGATLAANSDFMFPWSTPPNAIVYSAGRLTVRDMLRAGVWLSLIGLAANALVVTLIL
jgi:sodium-dependent dicarboxylate transporter 2/3/5